MEVLQKGNITTLLAFIPGIRHEIKDWRLINVSIQESSPGNILHIAKKVKDHFEGKEGKVFIGSETELLVIVKLGVAANLNAVEKGISDELPQYRCMVTATTVTSDGLQKVQIQLSGIDQDNESGSMMLRQRRNRKENVILVADDDMFMRSLVVAAVKPYGQVIEVANGLEISDQYLEHSPDILFLDIHMPGASGIKALQEILEYDEDAYVVMLSADSKKGNVLGTRNLGSKDFIAKPFTEEKILSVLKKCPTIQLQAHS